MPHLSVHAQFAAVAVALKLSMSQTLLPMNRSGPSPIPAHVWWANWADLCQMPCIAPESYDDHSLHGKVRKSP